MRPSHARPIGGAGGGKDGLGRESLSCGSKVALLLLASHRGGSEGPLCGVPPSRPLISRSSRPALKGTLQPACSLGQRSPVGAAQRGGSCGTPGPSTCALFAQSGPAKASRRPAALRAGTAAIVCFAQSRLYAVGPGRDPPCSPSPHLAPPLSSPPEGLWQPPSPPERPPSAGSLGSCSSITLDSSCPPPGPARFPTLSHSSLAGWD